MLGSLGLLLSSMIRQLENFAGVMNFVIFPMYFASSALYPLWRIQEASPLLHEICLANPFTYAVELIRFAFYGQIEWTSLARRRRLHGAVPWRRHHRLQSVARADDPQAGHRRKRLMRRSNPVRCSLATCSWLQRLRSRACRRRTPIRTGHASSARCRNCRSARSGTGRNCRRGRRLAEGPDIPALVTELAARRVPVDDAQNEIRDFAATVAADQVEDRLAKLVQGLFDHMNAERSQVISGIGRYARNQLELAERLRKEASELDALRQARRGARDHARTDRLNWETRIFEERVQSLTYVCEVPTLIEQRLYALAKTVAEVMKRQIAV